MMVHREPDVHDKKDYFYVIKYFQKTIILNSKISMHTLHTLHHWQPTSATSPTSWQLNQPTRGLRWWSGGVTFFGWASSQCRLGVIRCLWRHLISGGYFDLHEVCGGIRGRGVRIITVQRPGIGPEQTVIVERGGGVWDKSPQTRTNGE